MRKQIQNNSKKGIEFFCSKNPKKTKNIKKRWCRIANYTKLTVSLIAIILAIFVFTGVNLAYESLQNNIATEEDNYKEIPIENTINILNEDEIIEEQLANTINLEEQTWQIEIPTIDLSAPISQGTTQEIMKEYVGHFENTVFWQGNIGLAAHNRGFPINYFEKIKDLKIGDEIIYKTPYGQRIYVVNLSVIIEQTDWSYLQETDDNRITLITCVSNKPEHRLCVQAIEKIEKNNN